MMNSFKLIPFVLAAFITSPAWSQHDAKLQGQPENTSAVQNDWISKFEFCRKPAEHLCKTDKVKAYVAAKQKSDGQASEKAWEIAFSPASTKFAQDLRGAHIKTFRDLDWNARIKWQEWYRVQLGSAFFTEQKRLHLQSIEEESTFGVLPMIDHIVAEDKKTTGVKDAVRSRFVFRKSGYYVTEPKDEFHPSMFYATASNKIAIGSAAQLMDTNPYLSDWTLFHESAHAVLHLAHQFKDKREAAATEKFRACFTQRLRVAGPSVYECFADVVATELLVKRLEKAGKIQKSPAAFRTVNHEDYVSPSRLAQDPLIADLFAMACGDQRDPDQARDFVSGMGHLAKPVRVERLMFGHPELAWLIGCPADRGHVAARSCMGLR